VEPNSFSETINTDGKVHIVITIAQAMNKTVVAIRSDATLTEAVAFLTRHHIGGAPVVGDKGELVGVISESALIDVVFDPAVRDVPVSEYMTAEVQSVNPNAPLSLAAKLFALYRFRRLPVVEDGKLVGILTRRDLMNYAIQMGQSLTDPLIELIPSLAPTG
jgi:CBS domain-containing protein